MAAKWNLRLVERIHNFGYTGAMTGSGFYSRGDTWAYGQGGRLTAQNSMACVQRFGRGKQFPRYVHRTRAAASGNENCCRIIRNCVIQLAMFSHEEILRTWAGDGD